MKPIIVANWKCNPATIREAKFIFNSVKRELISFQRGTKDIKNVEVVFCPPFVFFSLKFNSGAGVRNKSSIFKLGAQNSFWEEGGAFTGEISPLMLKDWGCQYVILGHSERRGILGETDEVINKKIKTVLKVKLRPIFCIGEASEERKEGGALVRLKSQIEKGLQGIPQKEIPNIILAYEPIWAIGTGNACSPEEAQNVKLFLERILIQKFSSSVVKSMRMLYGGSVNAENGKDFIEKAGFNGLLIGGASLKPKELANIIKDIAGH